MRLNLYRFIQCVHMRKCPAGSYLKNNLGQKSQLRTRAERRRSRGERSSGGQIIQLLGPSKNTDYRRATSAYNKETTLPYNLSGSQIDNQSIPHAAATYRQTINQYHTRLPHTDRQSNNTTRSCHIPIDNQSIPHAAAPYRQTINLSIPHAAVTYKQTTDQYHTRLLPAEHDQPTNVEDLEPEAPAVHTLIKNNSQLQTLYKYTEIQLQQLSTVSH